LPFLHTKTPLLSFFTCLDHIVQIPPETMENYGNVKGCEGIVKGFLQF